jgi:hypothetical protein
MKIALMMEAASTSETSHGTTAQKTAIFNTGTSANYVSLLFLHIFMTQFIIKQAS